MEEVVKITKEKLVIVYGNRQEDIMKKETSKERYIDIVSEGNCLKIMFVPTNLCLGIMKCSRRGTPLDNAKLIDNIVKAYSTYMKEVYGL